MWRPDLKLSIVGWGKDALEMKARMLEQERGAHVRKLKKI